MAAITTAASMGETKKAIANQARYDLPLRDAARAISTQTQAYAATRASTTRTRICELGPDPAG
jgi:hypothetical protein